MEEKEKTLKKEQRYKMAMIIIITVFITFMATTLGIFYLFLNGKQVGKYVLVTAGEKNQGIAENQRSWIWKISYFPLEKVFKIHRTGTNFDTDS